MADLRQNKGCLLGWLFKAAGGASSTVEPVQDEVAKDHAPPPPMYVKRSFITDAEFSFFRVLQLAMKEEAYVLSQVSLGQLIGVKRVNGQQAWRNRIQAKAVDFLICDAQQMRPLLVVELDDSSHKAKDRQQRDQVVDEVLQAAGLPILHVKTAMNYDPRALRKQIDQAIGKRV